MFLAGFNSSGACLWAQKWGGDMASNLDQGLGLDIAGGKLALSGQVTSAVNFGGGWLMGNGSANYVVASFSLSGNLAPVYRWAKRSGTGTSGPSLASAVAMETGRVLVVGAFMGTADFGGMTATSSGNSAVAAHYSN
jgi:hypothetical protein